MRFFIIIITGILLLSCDNTKKLNEVTENKNEIIFQDEKELRDEFISYLLDSNSNQSAIKSTKSKSIFNPILNEEELYNLKNYQIIKSFSIKCDINRINKTEFRAKEYLVKNSNDILLLPENKKDFCLALNYAEKWTYMKLPSKETFHCIEVVKKVAKDNEVFMLRINDLLYYGFWDNNELKIHNPYVNKFLSDEDVFIMLRKFNSPNANREVIYN